MCPDQVYLNLLRTISVIKKDSSGLTWQAAKHLTAVQSLLTISGMEERIGESKTHR